MEIYTTPRLVQVNSSALSLTFLIFTIVHDTALYVDEYKLTYKYRLKAKAIDAFKDYNESIRKSGWAIKYVRSPFL